MYFDKGYIFESTGCMFESDTDVVLFLVNQLEYLSTHNKNYTKAQERKLYDMQCIVNALEV